MAGQLTLSETGTVTLDGSGGGTVRLAPDGSREVWLPASASVKVSSNTAEAACRIYVGASAVDANYVDGTLSGSTGDSTDRVSGYEIGRTRDPYIFAVWSGGDAGATATLNVQGAKEIR